MQFLQKEIQFMLLDISRRYCLFSDKSHYENVPFEVPDGWSWTTLGEIGNWQAGATPSRMRKDYYGGKIPWLKTGDLTDGYIYDIPETITDKALDETSVKLNPSGSVLIAMYGATIGKVGILTCPATTNQACCACVGYKAVTQKYLFYFLLSHKEEFIKMGGGGAQPNISKEKITSTLIPIPPIAEQNRITNEVEHLIALIESIEFNRAKLDQSIRLCKDSILDLATSGKLVTQDSSDEPALELLKRINPSFEPCDNRHYANLPETWEEGELGAICQLFDGKKVTDKELINLDVKYLRGAKEGDILSSGKYVPKDALMILVDGENSGEVFITPHEGYQGSTFKQLNIYPELNRDYVLLLIQHCREFLKDNKVGSAIPHLNKKLFKQIHVPIPPYNEQERIVQTVRTIMFKLDKILADL